MDLMIKVLILAGLMFLLVFVAMGVYVKLAGRSQRPRQGEGRRSGDRPNGPEGP